MSTKPGIKIVCLQGTTRPGNYTRMALNIVVDELGKNPDVKVTVIDPTEVDLVFPGQSSNDSVARMVEKVKDATGMVMATPEYHGTFSATMKLMIENLGFPSALAGKPTALLGVAAGRIGAIKSLEQLRGVCSHVGAIVLPGPVSIAGVQGVFDEEGHCTDPDVEKQIRAVATSLEHYIKDAVCPRYSLEALVRGGG
ncbi:MAG: NAD(P)H-dependent oxidoreductase [Gemmatimonadales bacterium]